MATPPPNRWIWIATVVAFVAAAVGASACCCVFLYLVRPGSFDANDFESTKRWATTCRGRIEANRGNDIAYTQMANGFEHSHRQHIGKTVRWQIPVVHVHENIILVHAVHGNLAIIQTRSEILKENRFDAWVEAYIIIEIGRSFPREKAAKLRPGSIITMTGTIQGIRFSHGQIMIDLTQIKGE